MASSSDGHDMVQPSGEGAIRCMQNAIAEAGGRTIDYINPHATSTPVGDIKEMGALRELFSDNVPALSATKSMTGHSLGAAGVQEAIYCLLMMRDGFIAPSINIDNLDPEFDGLPIVTETTKAEITTALSNSFGFGGTNGTVIFSKV